jgi:type I restriction enzyme, S subunit
MKAAPRKVKRSSGGRSASALLPGNKRTEVGEIPQDWETIALGELFEFKNGLNKAKRFFGFGTPIVNYMDVYRHSGIRLTDLKGRVSLSAAEIKNFEVRQGDVFFTRTSETSAEIGMAAVMLDQPEDAVFSGFVLRARPKGRQLDDAYKRYCFTPSLVRRQIVATSSYTTRALTNGRLLSAVFVPVPKLAEQRAIAEALSDVDALLGALEALIAKKRAIKQAAMQQLLTGKTRLPGFRGEWEVKQLGGVGVFLKGSGVKKDESQSGGLPCIRYGEIYTHHHDHIRFFNSWISPKVAETATPLRRGDVLFAGSGETKEEIGKCVAFDHDVQAYAGGDIVILRPTGVDSSFLGYLLNTHSVASQKASRGQGDAVVHISSSALADICVSLPSLEEQTAIATVLSEMDADIAALEARRDKTRAIKQGMMQQLLTGRIRLVEAQAA